MKTPNAKAIKMILETRKIIENHANGQLMYETTIWVVSSQFEGFYHNKMIGANGEILIRTGMTRRFWDNGQLNWQLEYNQDGSPSGNIFPQYRKDGSVIVR
jgi:hypothetical protein